MGRLNPSRETKFSGAYGDRGIFPFPVQLTTGRIGNLSYPVDPYTLLYVMTMCVCVFFPFILDIKFVGRTSRGHTGGRSHRISHPPSFCGTRLNFSREKDCTSFPSSTVKSTFFVY